MTAEATRDRILDTAERLFAERGLAAVSLRQIGAAAGQRHASAVHAHYGTKHALIAATFERRMRRIDARRQERLAELEAGPRPIPVHALVEVLICPLADVIESEPGGSHYARFLAELYGDPRVEFIDLLRGRYSRGVERAIERLVEQLPHLPEAVLVQRVVLAFMQVIYALADRERLSGHAAPLGDILDQPYFVANLVDGVTGSLLAPLSDATRVGLERASLERSTSSYARARRRAG
ncbi:MAG: TetR family transcriptional regulator [Proteobacteria bacterium]|nr:TetR family transcriptional regulator [Pseudomonadota bacterium]